MRQSARWSVSCCGLSEMHDRNQSLFIPELAVIKQEEGGKKRHIVDSTERNELKNYINRLTEWMNQRTNSDKLTFNTFVAWKKTHICHLVWHTLLSGIKRVLNKAAYFWLPVQQQTNHAQYGASVQPSGQGSASSRKMQYLDTNEYYKSKVLKQRYVVFYLKMILKCFYNSVFP